MDQDIELPSLYGIHGTAADDVWAVGWDGAILHWDGKTWSFVLSETDKHLSGICAIARDNAWAFGNQGAILQWTGKQWIRHLAPKEATFWRSWASGPDDVWAVVENVQTLRVGMASAG